MATTQPSVTAEEIEAATGWHLRPEGLCQGDRCIPLGSAVTDDGRVAISGLEARGFAVAHDDRRGLWAIGPQAGPTLASDELAPLILTGLDDEPVDVTTLVGPDRGVLLAFASW
jgi:hypothetical protein